MSFFKNAAKRFTALAAAVVVCITGVPATGYAMETNVSLVGLKGDDFVVVVDAGHDDKHHGASFTREDGIVVWEETLNLQIAKFLYDRLSKEPGIKVYMTRDTGACPHPDATSSGGDNGNRVVFANSVNCDLYVACHLNSSTKSDPRGASVYYPNASYDKYVNNIGSLVSKSILAKLVDLGLPVFSGGTITKNTQTNTLYPDGSLADYYTVIKKSKEYGFTGIIVEHAFMSNPEERAQFLYSEEGLKALGEADAEGIIETVDAMKALVIAREAYIEEQKRLEENKVVMFDPQYYWDHNPDLKRSFARTDSENLRAHFERFGKDEGRPTSSQFDVKSYCLANADLRRAFGPNNWRAYFDHFEAYGINEKNRKYTGVTEMIRPTVTYNGKNYSLVYDYNEFMKNYPELQKKYAYDDAGALAYFVTEGMKNGMTAKSTFDLTSYYNGYSDLRRAFGKNWQLYYEHYMNYGNSEGRQATGITELRGYATRYDNVDYKLVYDYNYYLSNYGDLRRAFNKDDKAALQHFVKYGISEGRKSSPTFDLAYYKSAYKDLIRAFGDNNELYINHYINFGYNEGRAAVKPEENTDTTEKEPETPTEKEPLPYGEDKMYTIMGETSPLCTVEAMMKYYNSKATFPTYYADENLDITTLEDFCKAYLEECALEGVKAEVAFTQAMLETNFLKYTGDVRIEKLNFAGLGAVDSNPTDGAAIFPDIRTGIRAQVQHLKVYATKEELKNPCVDPRFDLIKGTPREGSCVYVEYLGQKENPKGYGWATGKLYGFNIMTWMRNWLNV